ncbi:hypothetical protein [Novosphingobium sp. P6W]|uniref:hypothetical protein n=1 Tax=Novosphingobium sp. P6W TaxID=1609758 RepID=UPI0005C31387|nr:hypothetical protein [Novosphingobium sp. P6W]KIS30204.1 hypothetical protein TQ38_23880 [Novosphingobium sp. P6W]
MDENTRRTLAQSIETARRLSRTVEIGETVRKMDEARKLARTSEVGQAMSRLRSVTATNEFMEKIAAARRTFNFVEPQAMKAMQAAPRFFLPPSPVSAHLQQLAENTAKIAQAWKSVLIPLQPVFNRLSEQSAKAKLVEASGWLPHSSTPFHLIDEDQSTEEVDATIASFYEENWSSIETDFLEAVSDHEIDAEAKACFAEAIKAHKLGLYRTVPRTLFPEIERVAAVEFYDGKRKVKTKDGKTVGITSLPTIRRDIGSLPAGEVTTYDYGYHLFKKMESHLYEKVGEDPDTIASFEADPVPNRHASLHGIIVYNTAKSSLNALIMAEFLFHMMSRVKTYLIEEADEDNE